MSEIGQNTRIIAGGRTIGIGAIVGMVAGAVMAMYAMLASAPPRQRSCSKDSSCRSTASYHLLSGRTP